MSFLAFFIVSTALSDLAVSLRCGVSLPCEFTPLRCSAMPNAMSLCKTKLPDEMRAFSTRDDAEAACKSMLGESWSLVSPIDDFTNTKLSELCGANDSPFLAVSRGQTVDNCEEWFDADSKERLFYSNFAGIEPNNGSGGPCFRTDPEWNACA
jgi:hypothetical protein